MESRKGEKIRTRKRKPHIAHLLTLSLVWLILSAGGDVVLSAWQPPIGIPVPSFGIEETYRMYDTVGNRNDDLTYRENSEGGFYTHYIDNTDPNATNSGNDYGTIAKPRTTIPNYNETDPVGLPAGSVVEFHGGPYTYRRIQANGTSDHPVFIRGFDAETLTEFENIRFWGQYTIFENLHINQGFDCRIRISLLGGVTYDDPIHHIAVRNCEANGNGTTSGYGGIDISAIKNVNNIVIYDCHFHHSGQYDYDGENDHMGVSVGSNSSYVWVVDNEIHHNGGDSIQVSGVNDDVHHVYIGRNNMHEDGENAVDIKNAVYVIVSQNQLHSFPILNESSDGYPIVVHDSGGYHAKRVWFLYNEIYDAEEAAHTAGGAEDIYFIGNIIRDINAKAFASWGNGDIFYVNNTLHDTGGGISYNGLENSTATVINNIFGTLSDPNGVHIDAESDDVVSNNLFQNAMKINTSCTDCVNEADPLFVDAANNNFNLLPGSPAIDNGTLSDIYQTFFNLYGIDIRVDYNGTTRPQGSYWDIGAYESISSVDPNNQAPVLQAIGDKSVDENSLLTFDVNATDPNGEPITYSVQSLPSGATLDPQTGDFDWTPSYTRAGSYQVRFIASDGNSSDSETITITVNNVNRPPVIGAITDQSVTIVPVRRDLAHNNLYGFTRKGTVGNCQGSHVR